MLIPYNSLASTTLEGLIETYIDREGTDYGAHEISREDKVTQLREQIESGKVVIVYDEATESCNLLPHEQYQEL